MVVLNKSPLKGSGEFGVGKAIPIGWVCCAAARRIIHFFLFFFFFENNSCLRSVIDVFLLAFVTDL